MLGKISADDILRYMHCPHITKTRLFKYIENFNTKNENFLVIFFFSDVSIRV